MEPPHSHRTVLAAAAAAVGAATNPLGAALAVVAADLAGSMLSRREEERVADVVSAAARIVVEYEAGGESLRQDGFLAGADEWTTATEVIEAVLQAAKQTYEEAKLDHLAHLLARIGFEPSVGEVQAHHLVRVARQLTYDQYRLLELAARRDTMDLATRPNTQPFPATSASLTLLTDLWDLYAMGYVRPDGGGYWLRAHEVIPGRMTLIGTGAVLRDLLGLRSISRDSLERIALHLRW